MSKYKYKSIFSERVISAALNVDTEKYSSYANLSDLNNLELPDSIDLANNPDLIIATYNGAVINRMNRNDDGINKETVMAIKQNFLHKPTNIEHKAQKIVGHIVSVGWSSFGDNKLLTDEEVSSMNDPFNLVIGSVVYRIIDEKFSDNLLDSVDESSPSYMSVSASWEISFNDYHIILGSKNISEGEIISDPKHIAEMSRYLKAYGGKGRTKENEYVGRLIVGGKGEVLPVGFGFTSNPAAEVEGVVLKDYSDAENSGESSEAKKPSGKEGLYSDTLLELLNLPKILRKNI